MQVAGTKLNNTYTLIEEIGSGGGGVVYKAYHERLNTYVVVKQIKERVKGILDSRAEADILKGIKHTYLPTVYDFLEIEGEVYTVMDFIPGKSLEQALKEEGYFSFKQVLKWANQLAQALAYLHTQKPAIVHSDIKPANIMLTPEGDICLIDFNISLAFDAGLKTSIGTSAGYSPPEQYRNLETYQKGISVQKTNQEDETELMSQETELMEDETEWMESSYERKLTHTERIVEISIGRGIDERSDIYSLGATLYHLLTGIKPSLDFEGIPALSQCQIECSEGFVRIIEKMMELLPENRFSNGMELLKALQNIEKLDKEYTTFYRNRRIKKLMLASLYCIGMGITAIGVGQMRKEKIERYHQQVDQGVIYINQGLFNEAAQEIYKAIETMPYRIDGYEKEVLRLYEMGAYEECINYTKDILNNPPYQVFTEAQRHSLGNIYYLLAKAYHEQEDYSNAIPCFTAAIENNHSNNVYFRDYAISLTKVGNIEKAQTALEVAMELELGDDSIYLVQAEIAYAQGDDIKAEEDFLTAISLTTDDNLRLRATLLCAKVYQRMGIEHIDNEMRVLEQAMNESEGVPALNLLEELAGAYTRKARSTNPIQQTYYEKASDLFDQIRARGYATRKVLENTGLIYQALKDIDTAEQIFIEIVNTYPQHYVAYKRLAFLEAEKQQEKGNLQRDYYKMAQYYEEAKTLYQKEKNQEDQEMQILDRMMQDLKDGGWF